MAKSYRIIYSIAAPCRNGICKNRLAFHFCCLIFFVKVEKEHEKGN